MIRGPPGTGKTILGLLFLTADPDDTVHCVNFEDALEAAVGAAGQGFQNLEQPPDPLG